MLRHMLESARDRQTQRDQHPAARRVKECSDALNSDYRDRPTADDLDSHRAMLREALAEACAEPDLRALAEADDIELPKGSVAAVVGQLRVWGEVAFDVGMRIAADEKLAEVVGPCGQDIAGGNWPSAHHAVLLQARSTISAAHLVCFGLDFRGDVPSYDAAMARDAEPEALEAWLAKVTAKEGRLKSLPGAVLSVMPSAELEKVCGGKLANEFQALRARVMAAPTSANGVGKLEWLGPALLLLSQKPGLTKTEIAKHVGIDPAQLSRNETFLEAWRRYGAQGSTIIRSGLSGTAGSCDGVDDDFNPSRPASQQNTAEEETDRRIDRETAPVELRRK